MNKTVKLLISIFVGLDIFAVGWVSLAEFRYNLFGMGEVPGLGSAVDMGLFLAALLLGYVAGDRLFHFLTYNERRKSQLQNQRQQSPEPKIGEREERQELAVASVWEEGNWQDSPPETALAEAGSTATKGRAAQVEPANTQPSQSPL